MWRKVIERPKFWRWARLRVTNENLGDVRQSRLVQLVPEIKIADNINHNNRIRVVGEFFQAEWCITIMVRDSLKDMQRKDAMKAQRKARVPWVFLLA